MTMKPTSHFLVPFEKDDYFVEQGGVMEKIDLSLARQSRVALSGIGGKGESSTVT